MKPINIAIDGPAGAGKSTIARLVARELGYIYVDTGAMYRALTWKAIHTGTSFDDIQGLAQLSEVTVIELRLVNGLQEVWVDNEYNVTRQIREHNVTQHVSELAKVPEVRQQMVKLQQVIAANKGVVMDGRDIGTHVLPDAEVKVFLTASSEERARRRYKELTDKGYEVDLSSLHQDIVERDRMDSEREASPLKPAPDAVLVDSTGLTIDDVVHRILEMARTILGGEE